MNLRKIVKSFVIISFLFLSIGISKGITLNETVSYVTSFSSSSCSLNYTSIVLNYMHEPNNSLYVNNYNDLVNSLALENKNIFIYGDCGTSSTYVGWIVYPESCELLFSPYSSGNYIFLYAPSNTTFSYKLIGSSSMKEVNSTTDQAYRLGTIGSAYTYYISSDTGIKSCLLSTYPQHLFWEGEYYLSPSNQGFENPFTDDEIASLNTMLLNSPDLISYVPKDYRSNYFIIYNEITGIYHAYFYPSRITVKGQKFDEGTLDNDMNPMDYVSYKLGAGCGNFLWSVIQSVAPFDYIVLDYEDSLSDTYSEFWFSEKKNSHDVNKSYFDWDNEPLIYTSRNIEFQSYDISTGTFVVDSNHSIPASVLVNSDTNENYSFIIPETESDVTESGFLGAILNLPQRFKEMFNDLTGAITIQAFVLPVLSSFILILLVLGSSIALLGRALVFVYTLPTIQSSSAIFSIDVPTSSTGLNFTGLSWGTRFIQGFDLIRSYSWNGINLWSFFVAFGTALFSIYCVKLVRKHYHY